MKNIKHEPLIIKMLLFFVLFGGSFFTSEAQVAILGGSNFCSIRSDVAIQNKESITGYHAGAEIQYFPAKGLKKFSLINELILTQKGYQQEYEDNYTFRFTYMALPVLINYSVIPALSVQGGAEFGKLLWTNVKQGKKTYNDFDAGLVLGLTGFDNHRVSIYSRLTYGLSPMLDYELMDEMGNFTGKIKDLHNVCFSLGIKIKLRNEKIVL